MSYEEIKPEQTPTWKPEKADDFLEGILTNKRSDVGPNNSMMYEIQTDKKKMSVWGTTSLDMCMQIVKVGNKIKIVFEGEKNNPKTGRDFKAFKVYRDKDYKPEQEEIKPEQIPF